MYLLRVFIDGCVLLFKKEMVLMSTERDLTCMRQMMLVKLTMPFAFGTQ